MNKANVFSRKPACNIAKPLALTTLQTQDASFQLQLLEHWLAGWLAGWLATSKRSATQTLARAALVRPDTTLVTVNMSWLLETYGAARVNFATLRLL